MAEQISATLVNELVVAFSKGNYEDFRRLATELTEKSPSHYVGWKALGVAELRSGNLTKALQNLERAEKLHSNDAETLKYTADAQWGLGFVQASEANYMSAIARRPGFAEAHHALGTLLASSGRFSEAEKYFQRSIILNSSFVAAYVSLGVTLENLNRLQEAKFYFLEATRLAAKDSRTHYNLARFLQGQDDLDGAELAYRLALEYSPSNIQVLVNLSETLKDVGKFEEALTICDRAIAAEPTHARAHWNRSLQKLRLGQFEEGWQEYEWRWRYSDFPTRKVEMIQPTWLGQKPIGGRTILVHSEQGLGDTIQFCRYIKLLADARATVLFSPQKQLTSLMKYLIADCEIVDMNDETVCFDCHSPLLSLPLAFQTNINSIPNMTPYIRADPSRIDYWGKRIGIHGFKIGVCWKGNVGPLDRGRSFPVACLSSISQIPGVRLFSLSKGDATSQPQSLLEGMHVEVFGDEFDRGQDSFLDTAAVMKLCDLVITSDTAIAHLGGALGVATWVALKSVPDWRWMLERTDSPWYPSIRLFRQRSRGDWTSVFGDMENILRTLV